MALSVLYVRISSMVSLKIGQISLEPGSDYQPMDGRLEVRLFSVHHPPHILLLRVLEDLVQAMYLI